MAAISDNNLLTVDEVASMLRVQKSTIYKWTHIKFIPHVKVGGRIRFREQDIEAWLVKRSVKGRTTIKLPIDRYLK